MSDTPIELVVEAIEDEMVLLERAVRSSHDVITLMLRSLASPPTQQAEPPTPPNEQ